MRLALLCLLLAGCGDPIVKVETFPQLATVETGTTPCKHASFCVECGYDYRMKWHCGPALRPNCSGTQLAVVKHVPARRTHASGLVEDYAINEIVRVMGSCQ